MNSLLALLLGGDGKPNFNQRSALGQLMPGNIDLYSRPVVQNPDGSISTVRSQSANFGSGEVVYPTVRDDGWLMSDKQAQDQYLRTGRHLGIFDTPQNATDFAERLHTDQERIYRRK